MPVVAKPTVVARLEGSSRGQKMTDPFNDWLGALEKRHLADLRPSEVNRAVRALSDDYVHRRHRVRDDALAGRGKRAAFALFFGPLHFLVVRDIARQLNLGQLTIERVVDLGCGTGAGGAAVGSLIRPLPSVLGIDRLGWPLDEAAFTYGHFGLRHRVVRADVGRPAGRSDAGALIVAAYTINELDGATRLAVLERLSRHRTLRSALLVVEPIAKTVTPWWNEWRSALAPLGAREQEWRFSDPLPPRLRLMDRAAGLDHQVRKARSLWIAPNS